MMPKKSLKSEIVLTGKRVLIISDIHFTTYFNRRKLAFFQKLIPKFDQVIINGDFWSYYSVTFDQFINSRWKVLFPLFKSKNTVYVYGNHDQKKWCDNRVDLFSNIQGEEIWGVCGKNKFIFRHGHELTKIPIIDSPRFTKYHRLFHLGAPQYSVETLLLKIFGHRIYKQAQKLNNKIKNYTFHLSSGEYLVAGHTHLAEIDMDKHFINTGFIHSGVASYVVLENCKPKIVNERYDWGILP